VAGREPPVADSSSADPCEAELLSVTQRWAEAIVANDATRISRFVTDDWVIVSESGITPGSTLLALVENGELTHSAMAVIGEPRVHILGDTATVTARITNTAFYRSTRFDADEWTTDVFLRRGDRWLCVLTHYTAVAETE
jgi:ketosteroid isomerase-like protein